MSEHTPLPWHFSRKFRYVSDINHKVIVEIAPLVGFEANAAFIVKAVNNHEAMDKLLAEAADFLNNSPRMEAMDLGNKITQFRRHMQALLISPRHT